MNHLHLLEFKLWLVNIGLIAISLATTEAILRIIILLGSLIYTVLKIKDQLKKNSENKQNDPDETI